MSKNMLNMLDKLRVTIELANREIETRINTLLYKNPLFFIEIKNLLSGIQLIRIIVIKVINTVKNYAKGERE